jgi:hypothetical protein
MAVRDAHALYREPTPWQWAVSPGMGIGYSKTSP